MSHQLEVFPAQGKRPGNSRTDQTARARVPRRDVQSVRKLINFKLQHSGKLDHVEQHLLDHIGSLENKLFAPSVGSVLASVSRAVLKPSALLGASALAILYFVPFDQLPLEQLGGTSIQLPEEIPASTATDQEISLPDLAFALAAENHPAEAALVSETIREPTLPPAAALPAPQRVVQEEPVKTATLTKADESLRQQRNLVKFISGIIAAFRPNIKDSGAVARHIVELSTVDNVDPIYVAAVIAIESRFSHTAESSAGALGLMQLMPMTAKDLAKSKKHKTSHLVDPRTNIKLGISYLKQLEGKYRGNRFLALSAYNWGPSNVDRAKGRSSRIPGSVRRYSNTVLERTTAWRKHFNKANASADALQTLATTEPSGNS